MGLAPLFGFAGKGTRRTLKSRFAPTLEPLEQRAMMAAFQPGNIAVVRIGEGSSTLTAHPTEVYIDEYDPAGTLVQSIAMPTSGANAFTVGGTGFTDGGLSRSDNGQYLVAAGYRKDVSPLTTLPATDLAAATPRVIGRLAVNGAVDTTTAVGDAYSGNTFRGVASSDGTSFYMSGANVNPSGGVRYVASLGATSSTSLSNDVNDGFRQVYVVDGQLYIASGQGTPGSAVYSVGTGLPTSGSQTYAPLNQANNLQQYNSFILADLDVNVAGFDTVYAVDSRANSLGGLEKWTKTASDGLWHFNNKMQVPTGSMFGLTGYQQGSTVTMYVTSTSGGTGASSLYSIVDTAGYNANMNGSFTDLVPGGIGSSVFKNIALVPSFATTVTTSGGAAAYTENAAATAIDAGLTLSDSDSGQLYSATVAITGNFVSSQDVLSFTPQGGITGSYSALDGVLRLSGTASVADYQAVLRSVKYQNTSDNPNPLSRTISFSVRDNSDVKSNVATRALNITATNDAPVNTVPGGQVVGTSHTLAFSSLNGNQISIADVDVQSGNLLLSLSVNAGTLSLSTLTGLSGTGNGTSSLSYSGTLAALNTALNGLVYSAPGSPQAVTLTVGINDQGNTGTGGALSDSDNVAITVSAIANSPPVVTLNASPLAYTENAAATAVDSGLTVTDSDDANLIAATVSITGNFATGQDVLAFTNQLGITGSYDSLTGVLTLSGNSSVANYQTALRSVTYVNSSDNPSALSRTVTFVVSDGNDPSVLKNRTINVTAVNDAPVNTVPGGQSFAKNNSREFSTLRGNALSISDVDVNAGNEQISLSSANGTITLATLAGLTGSGNGTGSLTYTGTVAAINAALNGMVFNPTLNFTGATSISLTTNDLGNTGSGGAQSQLSTIPITVNEPAPLLINEILLRAPAFNATNQYVELRSTSGGNYAIPAGTYLVGIEGHEPFDTGEIHDVFNLNGAGMSTGSNGYLAILPSSNLYQIPTDVTDPAGNKYEQGPISPGFGNPLAGFPTTVGHTSDGAFTSIESANPVTFFLIQSSTPPAVGDDIDSNDDGIADGSTFNNWTILDSIGMGNSLDNSADYLYGAINFLDPTGSTVALSGNNINTNFTPAWVGRSGTTTGSAASDWVAAKLQGTGPFWEVSDTKVSQPGYGGLPLDTSAMGGHIAGPNFPGVQALPVVDLNGPLDGRDSLASFISGSGAVNIFSSTATTTDFDSPNLTQLTVTIGNLLDGANETLAAVTTGTSISASYSSGTLTLSGTDTLAHYQQVLRTVTYNNAATTPNRTTRTLTATASDGVNSSLVSNAQVGIFTNTFSARINEIDLDPPGNDNPYEYIELRGTPGSSLSNMYMVAFESVYVFGNPGDPGVGQTGKANFVQALSGTFPASGLVIIKSPSGGFTPPGGTTVFTNADLDTIGGGLKNGSNSFFLINSTTPIVKGTDYDTNDDGTLEGLPGSSEVVDSIAWEDRNFETDIAYGTNQVTQFDSSPDAVTRFPSNTKQTVAAWYNGALVQTGQLPTTLAYDPANTSTNFPVGGVITPGEPNYPSFSTIAGRRIFYNQSSFDGNSAAQGTADDNAIATDKTAYIPNSTTAVFNNVTSFTRGINGIMVDLAPTGGNHASINANDFVFKVGNNNSPSTWATVTATPTISVRLGQGTLGSDRVTITWASASIRNQWLEVQVLPTANTGLTAADVFFWGNKVGDTGLGTPATTFLTSGADKTQVLGLLGGAVGITSIRDFNRDNSVTGADATVVTGSLGSITRLNVAAAGPFAPEGDGGDSGVASALAASSTSASAADLPAGVARRLENVDLNSGRIAAFFHHLADQNTPGTRKLLVKIDAVADELGLEDELLDSILADIGLA